MPISGLPWIHEENGGKMAADDTETDTRLEGFEPTTPGSEASSWWCWDMFLRTKSWFVVSGHGAFHSCEDME